MSDAGKAVFLSYASQDAEVAKRICDALRAAGVEVWFDQNELVGGDAWDQKIRKHIKDCTLLIPIISAATQARTEGYFRLEWRLADQRTHLMAKGRPFLLPVVIDDTRDADAQVPDSFTEVQWTRLPAGETPPKFAERVKKLLGGGSEVEPGRPRPGNETRGEVVTPPKKSSRRWLIPTIIGAVAGVAFALWQPWRKGEQPAEAAAGTQRPTSEPTAPVSPARQLADRARAMNALPNPSRETLESAGQLIEQAKALDPADAEVWAVGAMTDAWVVFYTYDTAETRRERARSGSARALALDAKSFEARLARAFVLIAVVAQPAVQPEAERILRGLLQEAPDDHRVLETLANLLRDSGRVGEAADMFKRAKSFNAAGWAYFLSQHFDEAAAVVDQALLTDKSVANLELKSFIETHGREDLDAAQVVIDQLPASALLEDHTASVAVILRRMRREPEKMLEILRAIPRDWLSSSDYVGPKAALTGQAHAMANRLQAAQADWRAALQQVEQRLAADGNAPRLLLQKAELLANLGERAPAERLLELEQQLSGAAVVSMNHHLQRDRIAVLTGRRDVTFLNTLEAALKNPARYPFMHAVARFDPAYDPFRGDARFEKLLRDNLPKGAKPFADPKPVEATLAIDQKSVAVLAFANLSDDKGNEYFSDGISEELLNVLAKIPGLKVSARTSAFYFKGKEVPIPEIARQLGVAYVVEGSVRKQGDKVRITAQLIKAADGFHVWSDTFTRDLKDIFAVQDEIAGLIADNLQLKLGFSQASVRGTISPAAYQEYLVGRAAFAKSGMADLREAVIHFERAVAAEPKFTAAWVQLASAHTRLGRWGGAPTLASWQSARAAINRAKFLEPDSPDVLVALGWILRTADWDWRGAEQAFRRALELQPNQPDVLAGAAVLLFNIGKQEEAYRLGQKAVQLDPLNAGTHIDLSIMFYLNKNWAEAEQAARRALQLAPGGSSYHSLLGWSLVAQQRFSEAEAEIKRDSAGVDQINALGMLAIARGQGAVARAFMTQLEEIAQTQPDSADLQNSIAWIAVGLGEKDRAFAAMDKARASRDPSVSWLRNSWYLEPLYSDPRWNTLLHQVGLADEQLK